MKDFQPAYADRLMDLADAAPVRVGEREGIRKIFTRENFGGYRMEYSRVSTMLLTTPPVKLGVLCFRGLMTGILMKASFHLRG